MVPMYALTNVCSKPRMFDARVPCYNGIKRLWLKPDESIVIMRKYVYVYHDRWQCIEEAPWIVLTTRCRKCSEFHAKSEFRCWNGEAY